jgi:DNA topoisomerase-1
MVSFGESLPRIRERVLEDLRLPDLPREKVLATVVQLLDVTLIRVGNDEYARANDSFGLTTLREEHVRVSGTELRFRFRGKSGKEHFVSVRDRRLARIVQRFHDLPGEELFHWVDSDDNLRPVDSGDVNEYIRELAGTDFTAKDFRTWTGTVIATTALLQKGPGESERERKSNVVEAVKEVAAYLGNTPAIARKSYVHPIVVDSYMDGSLFSDTRVEADEVPEVDLRPVSGLRDDEELVLKFLRKRAESESRQQGAA